MHAKRSPNDSPPDPSLAATREVDSMSSLAAELLLRAQDDEDSGRRERISRPDPTPSPAPSRALLRDSLLPDEPSRGARTVAIVGIILVMLFVSAGAAFYLTR